MQPWSKRPIIYEINTWVWLNELSARHGRRLGLGSVPPGEWNALAELGVDSVWLMGVWERSPAGIAVSMGNPGLLDDFRRALPDFTAADNVGSPYCVCNYVVGRQRAINGRFFVTFLGVTKKNMHRWNFEKFKHFINLRRHTVVVWLSFICGGYEKAK